MKRQPNKSIKTRNQKVQHVCSIKWDFHHLFECHASDKCISCSVAMFFFSLLPSVRSIVPSHMSRSITTRCWAPAGWETQGPGAFYSKRLRAVDSCKYVEKCYKYQTTSCSAHRIVCSRKEKEKERKALTQAEAKTSCLVSCEKSSSNNNSFQNTYFSSWELAAISDLSVLSARGHPDTLERIKS